MGAQALRNMISRGELIDVALFSWVIPEGGKVTVGIQSECDGVTYFTEVKSFPFARASRILDRKHLLISATSLPARSSLLSERVHSEFLDFPKASGDKKVPPFPGAFSALRTTANRAQYVESTPANQTTGSCASFVITKKSSSTSAMGQ
jgi:hypothetical protein